MAAVLVGVMRLLGRPFDGAWHMPAHICVYRMCGNCSEADQVRGMGAEFSSLLRASFRH